MKVLKQLALDGSFCPSALNLLQQIPTTETFYVKQELRHPHSIYRLSLEKVGSAFCAVAKSYLAKIREHDAQLSSDSFEIKQLLADQQHFLHTLQEHLDELWLILKTLIDPSLAKKSPLFANSYVLENRLPGAKSFNDAIAQYRSCLRITNKLKHQQGHLQGIAVWTANGPYFGYYLEEPDAKGVLGPSPEIHPDQSALSFARDLLWHLVNVYSCSDKLFTAVQRAFDARGISLKAAPTLGLPIWNEVIEYAQKIPPHFFPKDHTRKVASLHVDDRTQTLCLQFPRRTEFVLPRIIKVSIGLTIDGYSPSVKTPLI